MKKIKKRKGKRKPRQRTKKLSKFLAITTAVIALGLLSIHAFIDFFERDIFDFFIRQMEKKSGGLYLINYDQVDLDFFQGSIHVKNLSIDLEQKMLKKIETGTDQQKILLKTTLPDLKIDGISFFKLIFNQSLYLDRLSLEGKELVVLRVVEPGQTAPVLDIPGVSLLLSKLSLTPYFSFESGNCTLAEPGFYSANGLYTLKVKKLNLEKSLSSDSVTLDSFELLPRHEKYQFARIKGYQTDRIHLKTERITFHQVDFPELFKNQSFYTRLLTIEQPVLEIFRDKNIARHPNRPPKKFPQQLLRESKFPLRIDNIRISGGHFVYIEHAEDEKKAGEIFFEDIQASLKNVTNFPGLLEENIAITVNASAKLMGKSLLRANFSLPINNQENRFTFSGFLGRMDMRVFNPVLVPNAHVRIKRGTIDKINVSATCDNHLAKGEMKMFYRNLKVSLLKIEKGGKYKKKGFKSFLANIIIRGNNPKPGKSLKVGRILYIREKPISFFAYIWKALLSGIKSSIGL